jgi:hypothetical protein
VLVALVAIGLAVLVIVSTSVRKTGAARHEGLGPDNDGRGALKNLVVSDP